MEGHLGFPLGEGEENAGESSVVLVPGPGDGVRLPLEEVADQHRLHRNSRNKGSRPVLHQGSPEKEETHIRCGIREIIWSQLTPKLSKIKT